MAVSEEFTGSRSADKIPAEQRLVIELAYFQGWTHTEIAEGVQFLSAQSKRACDSA